VLKSPIKLDFSVFSLNTGPAGLIPSDGIRADESAAKSADSARSAV
jgi:hypothetical protein